MGYVPDDFSRHVAAIHEAAHVVASLELKKPVFAIEIGTSGGGHFFPKSDSERPKEKNAECSVYRDLHLEPEDPFVLGCLVVDFAGGAAQLRLRGCGSLDGCNTDRANAENLLSAVCRSEADKKALRRRAIERATEIVREYWPQNSAIGLRLYHLRRLERPEIVNVLRRSAGGRHLLGEKDPPGPLPIITREITFSKPLGKFAALTPDGLCRFYDSHEKALEDRSEPGDGIRYREAMFI